MIYKLWSRQVEAWFPGKKHDPNLALLRFDIDHSVGFLVRAVPEALGYRTFEAAEPNSACDLLKSGQHFDLMVSDVVCPA